MTNRAEPADLRVTTRGAEIELTWQVSGATGDVYRGLLADVASLDLAPVACDVAGGSLWLPMPIADEYYLLCGRCGAARSTLGHDSLGNPIPLPVPACP